jgi:glutamate transport system permease protein
MNDAVAVLFDVPGPKARLRNLIFSVAAVAGLLALAWFVYARFDAKGQWDGERWKTLTLGTTWTTYLLPGLLATLKAFAVASILSLALGVALAVGRLSEVRALRWFCGTMIEFFRALPLLILMFFLYFVQQFIGIEQTSLFWAIVLALMLYNGSVLAEVIRAGVNALPRGQREAGMAVGLRPLQVQHQILLPQAFRSMLPAVIAQLVVVMKDTALGYILGFQELLRNMDLVNANYGGTPTVQMAILVAAMFITINMTLGWLATWTERRLSRSKKGGEVHHPQDAVVAAIPGTAATGDSAGTF